MLLRILLFSVLCLCLFSSCIRNYGIANQSYETRKLIVPHSAEGEDDTAALYIGAHYERYAGVTHGFYDVTAADDDYYIGSLDAHYARSNPNTYYAAGISAYKGTYNLTSFPIEEVQGNKSVWGFGATTEGGFNLRRGAFNIKPIGLKLTGLFEDGTYADFRESWLDTTINNTDYENGNVGNYSWNLSVMTGVSYNTEDIVFGTDLLLGASNSRSPIGILVYFSIKNVNVLLNYTQDLSYGRRSVSLGINYAFGL